MNTKIAQIIIAQIEDLVWIDRIAGLTQVARYNITADKIEKRFPIACAMEYAECLKTGTYDMLTPDSGRKSVVYFEDYGVNFTKLDGRKIWLDSRIRLVGWLNHRKLGGDCGDTYRYILDIISRIPTQPFRSDEYYSVMITMASQAVRDISIFSKYTYDEKKTQLLMYPFDFFAIDFRTVFFVLSECVEPTGVNPNPCL
jgi:hypothetical protein